MYTTDVLIRALSSYAKWETLPRELQINALNTWAQQPGSSSSSPPADATDEEVHAAFLRALVATVPVEWTVTQHTCFSTSNSVQPSMHAQAAGTPFGLVCIGGMQVGQLAQLKLKSELSWIKEHVGHMLAPDYSTVYQGSSSQLSTQICLVSPADSSKPHSPWEAHPAQVALPAGLIGHSAVLHGSRVFIFGGMETAKGHGTEAGAAQPAGRTSNKLRAYAIDEAGTQGGLLPVLSELPQRGDQPSSRMHHRAVVGPDNNMYVYGGVHIRDRDGARLPADQEAGVLHCFYIHNYTWSTVRTTGACRPCSTTLLAMFWHNNALWVIPDVLPRSSCSSGRSGSSKAARLEPPGYKLLRLDMDSHAWEQVLVQGDPPSLRTDSCSIYHAGKLLVYGGKTASSPVSMLSDLHVLDLEQQPPVWQQHTPRLVPQSNSSGAGAGSSNSRQQSLLSLAGHTGGVDGHGRAVFVGGYRRYDVKEPQSVVQVLQPSVKPPTPEAAKLSGAAAAPLVMAMQHVRLQLARFVRKHYPKQVLLRPDDGVGVRLPCRLLALYSCLFDDMFQEMLQQEDDGNDTDQICTVPVPGVTSEGMQCVGRWMMGLLALGSCSMDQLVEMYRVADRLIMERLMVELLELLAAADITVPQQAAAVLKLTGDLSGRADVANLGAHAAAQLRQQVCPATAPAIMALARQHPNQQLQDRCIEVMRQHIRNDMYAVLDFALRFHVPRLQGSCLAYLSSSSRGCLINSAERIVKEAARYTSRCARPPVIQMLEKDLLVELAMLDEHLVPSLPSYASAAQKLGLAQLGAGVTEALKQESVWRQLQQNKQVLQQMHQRFPELLPEGHQAAAGTAAGGSAQSSLLPTSHHQR